MQHVKNSVYLKYLLEKCALIVLNIVFLQVITEEIFFQDILCLEAAEEDLSRYILKKEDYKLVQEFPTLKEFVLEAEKIKNKE